MEDFLVILFQALFQIAFEILAYVPWDWLWYRSDHERTADSWSRTTLINWAVVASLFAGGLVGWVSLHFFPDSLLHTSWLRLVCLFVSPIASGYMGREMARWRAQDNPAIDPKLHFWVSLCFSIGLVWVRFTFAHRPGW